ncbi:glycosyltransferase family 2 protein [Actinokineospora inagensis]|uniref:glycosyltransferase family 2 protein n=1 Tax=Actinokineospora inagensis TaxID=103730 RepID=UPI0003F571D6|nr:glycosyltransferase family 2 protein [Actinokineospora inagensis]
MIPAWVLAAFVVGVGFVVGAVLGVFRRDRERGSPPVERGEPVLGEVAVLILARDAEDEVAAAITAAARLVPRTDIHVVVDASADRTLDVAHAQGVNVAETVRPSGRSGAVSAALTGFGALDRYRYVLLLDVDHRPHPRFLDRTLPLFEDPAVVAIAGYAQTEWDTARRNPVARLLTAYRARSLALTQWLLTVDRTRPRTEVARLLPSPARLYRSSVLAELDLDPDGVAVADFDLSNQIYRRRLGRVVVVRGAVVSTRDPDDLRTYCTQLRLWAKGFWQAARRDGGGGSHTRGIVAFAAETVVASLLWIALPVLVATGVVTVPALLLGVFVPDLLLTLVVASRQQEPRYLPVAVFLPLVRVLDGVLFLSALVTPVRARWLSPVRAVTPAVASRSWWRTRPIAVAGWFLALGSAGVFVLRVYLTAATLPASPLETTVIDGVYSRVAGIGEPPVAGTLVPTNLQLVLYGGISRSFDRYSSVLLSAREASVAAAVVLALCLLLAAALLKLRPLAVAVAIAAACTVAATAFATAGPGPLATTWLGVAGVASVAAITRRDIKPVPVVVVAAVAAVATAPMLVLPAAVGALAWSIPTRRWSWSATFAVVAVVGVVPFLYLTTPAAMFVPGTRSLLLLAALVVALGGLITPFRSVATGVAAASVLALVLETGTDQLVPVALTGAVFLTAAMLDRVVLPAISFRPGIALATLTALAGAVWGVKAIQPTAPTVDHRATADWYAAAAGHDMALSAPPLLASDLRRDLHDTEGRVRLDDRGALTANGRGLPIATFPGVTVSLTDGGAGYVGDGNRAIAGAQLAANTRITAPATVRAALRAGQVDLRVMTVLAEISAGHAITVAEVTNPGPETGSDLPLRTAVLTEVDGHPATDQSVVAALTAWVAAQQPPYAPDDSRATDRGFTLSWRIPAPGDATPN